MANEPIQGGPYPDPSDPPDGPAQMSAIVAWIAGRSNMRFASTAARDAAIPSPVSGMSCYVDSDKTYYACVDGAWIVLWQDSGWVDVPLLGGFTNTETLQVRGLGHLVYMRGRVSGAFTVPAQQIGNVAAAYRPASALRMSAMAGTSAAVNAVAVLTSGGALSVSTSTAATHIVQLNLSWTRG